MTTGNNGWYRCRTCGDKFTNREDGGVVVRCAVLHSPGACCHYGEAAVTEEDPQ